MITTPHPKPPGRTTRTGGWGGALRSPRVWGLGALSIAATGIGVALGWLALREVAWGMAGDLLTSAGLALLVPALALYVAAGLVRGVRWQLLLEPERVGARRLFLIEQSGTALDTLSMVHLLDEVVETGILTLRDRVPLGTVLSTLAAQRTMEFATTVALMAGGALFLPQLHPYWPYLTTGIVVALAAVVALITLGPALHRVWLVGRLDLVRQFADGAGLIRTRWRRSLAALAISVAQTLLLAVAGVLLGLGVDMHIGPAALGVVTLGVFFFGATVPGLPLSIGTFEFAAVTLLGRWDVPAAQAVSFTVLLRGLTYLPPLLIGGVFLSREGLLSLGQLRALTRQMRKG
ncbi:MAG: lysylphosphatidylglycerol synthase transmembrane domain-containing protein [Chloroflexota bacterium]